MSRDRNPRVIVLQTVLPDYRLPFHRLVAARLNADYRVCCGEICFEESTRTAINGRDLIDPVRNSYLGGRRFLWQHGGFARALSADVVVLGFNLRILSNYGILLIRKLLRRRTILWGHIEGRSFVTRCFRFTQILLANAFVTYTRRDHDQLRAQYPRLKVAAAPNACLHKADCRFLRRPAGEVNEIIYVGRLTTRKKPGLLVDAFHRAIRNSAIPSKARLRVIGSGPEEGNLRGQVAEADLRDRVIFHGHISAPDRLRELYATALVSASPGYVGLSAIQSFAFGVPMLVARGEPHSPEFEACQEEFNTLFFDSDDPASLADLIGRIYQEKHSLLERRSTISTRIRDTYTYEKMADTFVSVIGQ